MVFQICLIESISFEYMISTTTIYVKYVVLGGSTS